MFTKKAQPEFEMIINKQHSILRVIGWDAYSRDFKFAPMTFLIVFLACLFMVVSLFDLYYFRDDAFNFTFVLVTLCYGTIGCARLGLAFKESHSMSGLVIKAKETYRQATPDSREQSVLLRYTKLLKKCVTCYTITFIGGCVLTGFLPLCVYLWNGLKILPFGVILPFIDPDSRSGYQLNYAYQVSCILWTPPGLTASQNVFFALIFNICIQFDMLVIKLDDLDKLIVTSDGENMDSAIHDKIKEIVRYQQRLYNFILTLKNLYSTQIFIDINCNAFQVIVTLFVLHIDIWMPGYMMISVATFQIFLLSFLGTLIEVKIDVLNNRIYDISWHKMPALERKNVQFMLHRSQQTLQLTYGGLVPLNMNLFVSVYKMIYSIFMMLQNL
ncbi:odorant receptor 67d-like [Toxorhynchites rutilus septentrionalis]|uniref:odorant receptor 67d-like n=1 Tax=Toxorhynchites rutilus septentrionalis TaxID=329112 RepID=UPI0024793416|nr:odorant receptor 67d-like [Toxorhynchites rutilus septentrionalis]